MSAGSDAVALNFLLKATSKDAVSELCNEAFRLRKATHLPDSALELTGRLLGTSTTHSRQVLEALVVLVKQALFLGSVEAQQVLSLFPDGFHKNLKDLLAKILVQQLPVWKAHSINNMVSLPRLVDFDWRVDVKTSSDSIARMSVPTCLMQMKVSEPISVDGQMAEESQFVVELSKEKLETMLDGLGKIRNQLSSVTANS